MSNKATKKVTLKNPIKREGGDISELTLREPKAGDLRQLKLLDVLSLDIDAIATLIPRIARPAVVPADIYEFSMSDLAEVGGVLSSFLDDTTLSQKTG